MSKTLMRRLLAAPCSLVLLLALGSSPGVGAGKHRLRLDWSELDSVIVGRKIATVLPGGTAVEGKVLQVDSDALLLQVTKTSDRKVIRKGKAAIPRGSLSVLRITRYSKHWRMLLAPGLPAATLGAMAVAVNSVRPAPDPAKVVWIGIGATAATTMAGYYAGKALDCREFIEITMVGNKTSRGNKNPRPSAPVQ